MSGDAKELGGCLGVTMFIVPMYNTDVGTHNMDSCILQFRISENYLGVFLLKQASLFPILLSVSSFENWIGGDSWKVPAVGRLESSTWGVGNSASQEGTKLDTRLILPQPQRHLLIRSQVKISQIKLDAIVYHCEWGHIERWHIRPTYHRWHLHGPSSPSFSFAVSNLHKWSRSLLEYSTSFHLETAAHPLYLEQLVSDSK